MTLWWRSEGQDNVVPPTEAQIQLVVGQLVYAGRCHGFQAIKKSLIEPLSSWDGGECECGEMEATVGGWVSAVWLRIETQLCSSERSPSSWDPHVRFIPRLTTFSGPERLGTYSQRTHAPDTLLAQACLYCMWCAMFCTRCWISRSVERGVQWWGGVQRSGTGSGIELTELRPQVSST